MAAIAGSNEGIFKLGFEVFGIEQMKAASDNMGRFIDVIKRGTKGIVQVDLVAVDDLGPVLKKAALSVTEFNRSLQQLGSAKNALRELRQEVKLLEAQLAGIAGTSPLAARIGARSATPYLAGAVAQRYGLYEPDFTRIRNTVGLNRAAAQTMRLLNRPQDLDTSQQLAIMMATVGRLAPRVLGQRLPPAMFTDELSPGEKQAVLAQLSPQIAEAKLMAQITAGLRSVGFAQARTGRGVFRQLRGLEGVEGTLAGLGTLSPGEFFSRNYNAPLATLAAAVSQRPMLMSPGRGAEKQVRRTLAEIAESERFGAFGPVGTKGPTLLQTTAGDFLDTMPLQLGATRLTTEGRFPRLERVTTSRPRTEDIRRIYAGPMQTVPEQLPLQGIETTGRVIPSTPTQQLWLGIDAARSIGQQARIEAIAARSQRAIQEAEKSAMSPDVLSFLGQGSFVPYGRRTGLMARIQAYLGQVPGIRKLIQGDLFDLGESGFARFGGKSRDVLQEAVQLLTEFKQPQIFPSTMGRMLRQGTMETQRIMSALVGQGYLQTPLTMGEPGYTGFPGAYRINREAFVSGRAKEREARLNLAQEQLAEETQAEARQRRSNRNAAKKLQIAQEEAAVAGGGGGSAFAGLMGGGGGGEEPPERPPTGYDRFRNFLGGGGRFGRRFSGLTYFIGSAAILYPIASTIFQTLGAAAQLEVHLKRIQGIIGSTDISQQFTIRQSVLDAARTLGEDVNQVAEAAQAFAQAGVNVNQLGTNMQAAALGAKAFGTEISEVANYIIAVGESSRGRVGPEQAVNLLAAIGRRTNVGPLSIMQTIQNINPLLEAFNEPAGTIPNEALLGSIAGVVKQRTGVANPEMALRFAISQLGNPKAVSRLERITGTGFGTAESGGQDLRPFIEILGDVARSYQNLINTGRSAEAKELLRDFFGARQAVVGTTILRDWTQILKTAAESIKDTGAAAELAGPQVETFISKFSRLKTDLTGFWDAFFAPAGVALDTLDKLINKMANFQAKGVARAELGATGDQSFVYNDLLSKFVRWNAGYNPNALAVRAIDAMRTVTPPAGRSAATPFDIITGNLAGAGRTTFGGGAFQGIGTTQLLSPGFKRPTAPSIFGFGTGKTPDTRAEFGQDLQDWLTANDKISDRIKSQTELWERLGGVQNRAKIAVQEYTKQLEAYYALPKEQRERPEAIAGQTIGGIHTPGRLDIEAALRTARAEEIGQALGEQDIRNRAAVDRATNQARRTVTELQLRFLSNRRVNEGRRPEAIEAAFKLIDFQTESKNMDLLSTHLVAIKEAVAEKDEKEVRILNSKYLTNLEINGVENQRLKTEFLINLQQQEQLENLQKQRQESQALFGSALKGIQDLPKALEQARAQHKSMLGAGLQAVLGPITGTLAQQRGQGILERFKDTNVAGLLSGTAGIDKQIENAQNAYYKAVQTQNQTGALSPGQIEGLRKQVETLKNVKAKQQLYTQVALSGGEIITAATGGNVQNAEIGGELGAAVGNLIVPGAGGIVGGALGSLIGGMFGKHKPPPAIGHLQIIAENTREQVRLLENTNKLLEVNFVSFNVPTGFRLPSYVPGSFGGVGGLRGAGGGVVHSNIAVNVNVGGTNVSADKLGNTIAQAISDRLELESRTGGNYFPRLLYG